MLLCLVVSCCVLLCLVVSGPTCRSFVEFLCSVVSLRCHIVSICRSFVGISVLSGQSEVSCRAHLAWFGVISLRGGTMHALPDTGMSAKVSQVGQQHCLVLPTCRSFVEFLCSVVSLRCHVVPTCRSFVEFLCSVGSLRCHIVPTWHGLEGFPCEVVQCMHYLTQIDSESQSGRSAALPCCAHLPKFR